MRAFVVALFGAALLLTFEASARGSSGHSGTHSGSHGSAHSSGHSSSHASAGGSRTHSSSGVHHAPPVGHVSTSKRAAQGAIRDKHGRIARSVKAKDDFKKGHPCPSTGKKSGACPGYVIDHRQALKHGGTDTASNMQWQTSADARIKDRSE
jgi:hypothetical protein